MKENSNKMTIEEFKSLYNDNKFEILNIDNFNGKTSKLITRCKSCNTIKEKRCEAIIKGSCKECYNRKISGRKPKNYIDYDTFLNRLLISKRDIEIINPEDYNGIKSKISIRCNKCNNISNIVCESILNNGCEKCSVKHRGNRKYTEKSINEILEKNGIRCENFESTTNDCNFFCNYGHTWKGKPKNYIGCKSNRGCPQCSSKKKRMSRMGVLNEIEYLNNLIPINESYTWIDKNFSKTTDSLRIKHNDCGCIYYVKPSQLRKLKNGKKHSGLCPFCRDKEKMDKINKLSKIKNISLNSSYGSIYFIEKLLEKNIEFIIEKPINLSNTVLYSDIYLSKEKLYIEIDGEQHFSNRSNSKWNLNIRERDFNKNMYMLHNNLNMIRIKYDDKEEEPFEIFMNYINNIHLHNDKLLIIKNGTIENQSEYYGIEMNLPSLNLLN